MRFSLPFALCALTLASCADHVTNETGGTSSGGGPGDAGVKPSQNCPQAGGSMVEIPDTQGGSYCIDQNLVTNAAYAKWLDTNPSQDLRPAVCRPESFFCQEPNGSQCPDHGETSVFYHYTPYDDGFPSALGGHPLAFSCPDTPLCGEMDVACSTSIWPPPSSKADYPVVNITWCDAFAYCNDHGKRLCGKIGGGALDVPTVQLGSQELPSAIAPEVTDPNVSEYFNAATRGGGQKYPYGEEYDLSKCPASAYCWMSVYGSGGAPGKLHAVESIASCQGGYPGVFDLVGNAAEFIDACNIQNQDLFMNGHLNAYAGCIVAGGADESGLTDGWLIYPFTDSNTGFRCCADAAKP